MQDRTNQRVEQLHKLFLSEMNDKGVPHIPIELFRYVLENNDRELFMYMKLAPDFIWNAFIEEREQKREREKQATATDSEYKDEQKEAIDFADWIINQRLNPSAIEQCWYTLGAKYTSKELYIKFKNKQNETKNNSTSN
jgi:hypothetical protein